MIEPYGMAYDDEHDEPEKKPTISNPVEAVVMCFLVGRWLDDDTKPWEVQGIYDDEEVAKKACTGRNWFVMPTPKNTALPADSKVVGYYPNT